MSRALFKGHCIRSIWEGTPPANREHPNQKPVALFGWCIENTTNVDMVIIDPFLGSGTTLIAADQLDRVCFGMEILLVYTDVIVQRFINHKGNDSDVFLERDGKKIPYSELMVNA